jgi:hypothetical protein
MNARRHLNELSLDRGLNLLPFVSPARMMEDQILIAEPGSSRGEIGQMKVLELQAALAAGLVEERAFE